MATPTGVDTITSISRRILREEATDVYYKGSPFTWRLFKLNRVVRRGGLHIESRFIYQPWATGGAFYGPEVLNVEPSDTEISGAWDWKEYYTNVTLDQRSLIRADSEYAVANYVVEQCELAKMDLRDKIAFGIWSDGTNFKAIDGMYEILDTGVYAANYAGLEPLVLPVPQVPGRLDDHDARHRGHEHALGQLHAGCPRPDGHDLEPCQPHPLREPAPGTSAIHPADSGGRPDLRQRGVLGRVVSQPALDGRRAHARRPELADEPFCSS